MMTDRFEIKIAWRRRPDAEPCYRVTLKRRGVVPAIWNAVRNQTEYHRTTTFDMRVSSNVRPTDEMVVATVRAHIYENTGVGLKLRSFFTTEEAAELRRQSCHRV